MEGMNVDWRKPRRSGGNGGNCVEAGNGNNTVLVRDSKDRAGAVLSIPAEAWRVLAEKIKRAGQES